MAKNQHSFKKGYDAKRYVPVNSGLVEYYAKLGDLHRLQSLDAANFVFQTMNDEKAALKLRIVCAQEIMNRAAGKPVDRSVIVTLEAGNSQDPAKLTTDQLESIIAKLDDKQPVIEAEFKDIN
jgi:hypothetical protein